MHLPKESVNFRMEYGGIVSWSGSGPLPEAVLNFVQNNGHLPRYNEDETINQDGVPGDEWVYQDEINEDEWMEDES